MREYLGQELTIVNSINGLSYEVKENDWYWTDEMLEDIELVETENRIDKLEEIIKDQALKIKYLEGKISVYENLKVYFNYLKKGQKENE